MICTSALSQSLSLLEVGRVNVMSFGTQVHELTESRVYTLPDLIKHFPFNEQSSQSFSEAIPTVLDRCNESASAEDDGSLIFLITDGRFDKERCRPFVQRLISAGHYPVLIVMDANKEESILSIKSVSYETVDGKRRLIQKPFLSQTDCPFPFYAIIQEPSQLPVTLADIIRQWIEVSNR